VGFQRIFGVGQLRQRKGHDFLLEWRRRWAGYHLSSRQNWFFIGQNKNQTALL